MPTKKTTPPTLTPYERINQAFHEAGYTTLPCKDPTVTLWWGRGKEEHKYFVVLNTSNGYEMFQQVRTKKIDEDVAILKEALL
jgi:hypothetical protein